MSDSHISSEELAAFAAGSMDVHEAKLIVDHLEACPRCSEAFRSGVRLLGVVGDDLPAHALPDDVLNQARRANGAPYPGVPRSRSRLRMLWPAAAAAAVIIAGIMVWQPQLSGPDAMSLSTFPAIETAAGEASSYSMLVIPGAEALITNGNTPQRSGLPEPSQELETSLEKLLRSHAQQTLDIEEAYALIAGKLAAGDYRVASELLGAAQRDFDERAEFSAARGIALFHLNQLPEAEETFRAAIAIDPDRPVYQYNLAVVLQQLGETEESRSLAEGIVADGPDTPLAERARALLQ